VAGALTNPNPPPLPMPPPVRVDPLTAGAAAGVVSMKPNDDDVLVVEEAGIGGSAAKLKPPLPEPIEMAGAVLNPDGPSSPPSPLLPLAALASPGAAKKEPNPLDDEGASATAAAPLVSGKEKPALALPLDTSVGMDAPAQRSYPTPQRGHLKKSPQEIRTANHSWWA
jgi:hypothetical protein